MVSRCISALREAQEEHLVVDRLGRDRSPAPSPADRAETRDRGPRRSRARCRRTCRSPARRLRRAGAPAGVGAARRAELRGHLPPGEIQRLLDDHLGDLGEPVADPHQRQPAGEVRHRDAEHRRALELAQHLHLALGSSAADVGHPVRKFRVRARRAVGSASTQRSSSNSSSSSGNAAICAARNSPCAQIDQPALRAAVLVEQREIRRPRADGLEHVQHAPSGRRARGLRRLLQMQQLGSSSYEPARPGVIEAPQYGATRGAAAAARARGHRVDPQRPAAGAWRVISWPDTQSADAGRAARGAVAAAGSLARTAPRNARDATRRDVRAARRERGHAVREPMAQAMRSRASASAGSSCVCSSSSICSRFSSRRRKSVRSCRVPPRRRRQQLLRRRAAAAPPAATASRRRAVLAAADELERLHDELDLADAARAELDVVARARAARLPARSAPSSRAATRTRRSRDSGDRRTGAARLRYSSSNASRP